MPVARLVRAQFLSLREKEFVEAARALGASRLRQVMRHILPNALGPVIVAGTINVASAIIAESTLSFLGLGFPPDIPTWGRVLFDAKDVRAIIRALRPDVHVKGTDYTPDTIPEADEVRAYGGRVAVAGDPKDHSTTALAHRLGGR